MAITSSQQGEISQAAFVKIAILTSGGALVPTRPVVDEERRDFEVHIKRHFEETLAIQMKTAKRVRLHGRSRRLQIDFDMKLPLVIDPHLWFLLARFDIAAMGLDDPLFLVPSAFFIRNARHGVRNGMVRFQFQASMELTARDKWSVYGVLKADLGNRMMQILEELSSSKRHSEPSAGLLHLPNVIWVPSQGAAFKGSSRRAA